jgi:hypothetical protein
MTRKDYIRFAAMLKQARYYTAVDFRTLELIVKDSAQIFAADNERFDRSRFLKACGVES